MLHFGFRYLYILLAIVLFTNCQEKIASPNILFIAIDDLRPELGCYGNTQIKSPNMDRLASEGFLFRNHFVQVPTCGASRCALLTGRRPWSKAHLQNSVMADLMAGQPENENPETFIHHLRRNGYYTVGIGKISHSADGLVYGYEDPVSDLRELPHSWNERLFDHGKWGTGWNAFFGYADGSNRQGKNKQVKPYERGEEVGDDGYPDGLSTNLAKQKLTELKKKGQPFFLGVGYFKPHLPFTSPSKYWDLYNREDMSLPLMNDIPAGISKTSLHSSNEFNQYALGEEKASLDSALSDDYIRKLKHAYSACVSYADAQVGALLNQLKELGLEENTIVVIWGDHGWHLGDERVWGKHTLSDYALRSALIMKIPGMKESGKSIESVVESVDIYPTLMQLCQVSAPPGLDGESFLPKLDDLPKTIPDVAYSYWKNGMTVRTDTFRLTKYLRDEEPTIELYNYVVDPIESKNIVLDRPDKVAQLMPVLDKGNLGFLSDLTQE
jgi:arylsulfatase A-like enzyme